MAWRKTPNGVTLVIFGDDNNQILELLNDDGTIRVPVDSKTKLVGGIGGVTGQWHWEKWTDDQSIGTTFVEVYSNTDPGVAYGFYFQVNTDKIDFQLEVDGYTIMDFNLNDLKSDFKWTHSSNNNTNNTEWFSEYSLNRWHFRFPDPTSYSTLIVKMKVPSGQNKTVDRGITVWREDE